MMLEEEARETIKFSPWNYADFNPHTGRRYVECTHCFSTPDEPHEDWCAFKKARLLLPFQRTVTSPCPSCMATVDRWIHDNNEVDLLESNWCDSCGTDLVWHIDNDLWIY